MLFSLLLIFSATHFSQSLTSAEGPKIPTARISSARDISTSSAVVGAEYLCPSPLSLISAGQCRGRVATKNVTFQQIYVEAKNVCGPIGALPVMIKTAEEQAYWRSVATTTGWLPLEIGCFTDGVYRWDDGTAINKNLPPSYNEELNNKCKTNSIWWMSNKDGSWQFSNMNDKYEVDFYCIAQLQQPAFSDPACEEYAHDQTGGKCYMVSTITESWSDAQFICRNSGGALASIHNQQENAYMRQLAVSKGIVNGQLIGASAPAKTTKFMWVDGSPWDYTNYVPGFPISGFGECLVMDTNDQTGQWANVDCSTKMPFVCQRKPFADGAVATCPGGDVREGDLIRTPGFPESASVPCDFFLKVDAGKQVEIEIVLLEANSCCDYLALYEGTFGGDPIANVTGAFTNGRYRTKSSNMMRVSWHPNGGVNVRGALFTFNAV